MANDLGSAGKKILERNQALYGLRVADVQRRKVRLQEQKLIRGILRLRRVEPRKESVQALAPFEIWISRFVGKNGSRAGRRIDHVFLKSLNWMGMYAYRYSLAGILKRRLAALGDSLEREHLPFKYNITADKTMSIFQSEDRRQKTEDRALAVARFVICFQYSVVA
jgi:hypothetical protein